MHHRFEPHQRSKRPEPSDEVSPNRRINPVTRPGKACGTRSTGTKPWYRCPGASGPGNLHLFLRPYHRAAPRPPMPGRIRSSPSREQGRSPARSPPPLRVGGSSASRQGPRSLLGAAKSRLPASALQQAPGIGGQAVDRHIRDQWPCRDERRSGPMAMTMHKEIAMWTLRRTRKESPEAAVVAQATAYLNGTRSS